MWTAVIFEFGVLLIGFLIYLRARDIEGNPEGGLA